MLSDKEITNEKDDLFGINQYVENFIKMYISSDFKGSILLSGKWGAGKSSFLNLVRAKTKKESAQYIDINFWKSFSKENAYENIACVMFPVRQKIIRLFPIVLICSLAIINFFINIFLKSESPMKKNQMIIWLFLVVFSGLVSLTIESVSLDSVFEWLIRRRLTKNGSKKYIFIVDDFDRVDEKTREELYGLLMNLKSFDNSVVIVIGDYSLLVNSQESSIFIQKIMSNIEFIPKLMDSEEVWNFFEKELEKNLDGASDIQQSDILITTRIKECFIKENRTMREGKQLLNLFSRVYFERNRGYVNFSQQLVLCYIFQFYNDLYKWIIDNQEIIYKEDYLPFEGYKTGNKDVSLLSDILEKNQINYSSWICILIYQLFKYDKEIDFKFVSLADSDYMINYQIESIAIYSTLNVGDVDKIFIDSKDMRSSLKKVIDDDQLSTFHKFFVSKYIDSTYDGRFDEKKKDRYLELLKIECSLSAQTEYERNSKLVLNEPTRIIYKIRDFLERIYGITGYDQYLQTVFENKDLDLSQKLDILPKFVPAGGDELTQKQIELVDKLFIQNGNFEFFDQKKKRILIYFYSIYVEEIDPELRYADKFETIFSLSNDKFYDFLVSELTSNITSFDKVSITEKAIHLSSLVYSEDFKQRLLDRIDQLDENQKLDIINMIERGSVW